MTQTFTPSLDITAPSTEKEQKQDALSFAEPSQQTIQNILNYSKSLEIKQSQLVKAVEIVKT